MKKGKQSIIFTAIITAVLSGPIYFVINGFMNNQDKLIYTVEGPYPQYDKLNYQINDTVTILNVENKGNNKLTNIRVRIDPNKNLKSFNSDMVVTFVEDKKEFYINELHVNEGFYIKMSSHQKMEQDDFDIVHDSGRGRKKFVPNIEYILLIVLFVIFILQFKNYINNKRQEKINWNEILSKKMQEEADKYFSNHIKFTSFDSFRIKEGDYIDINIGFHDYKLIAQEIIEDEIKNDNQRSISRMEPMYFTRVKFYSDHILANHLFLNINNKFHRKSELINNAEFFLRCSNVSVDRIEYIYFIDDSIDNKHHKSLKLIRLSIIYINMKDKIIELKKEEIVIDEPRYKI